MEMNEQAFTMDGNHYKVEHTAKYAGNKERVIVWTVEDDLIGDAEIDDNLEQIFIMYNQPAHEHNDTTTFPYSDYDGDSKVVELAKWIIATHPIMA